MKILITGGAGFIGSHLAERLLAAGDEVAVIDNLSTGSLANIEHLKSNPKFKFVRDTIQQCRCDEKADTALRYGVSSGGGGGGAAYRR